MAVDRKMLVIIGPTASGKSELAMALARRTGGEILSVDSMQVYRGMDIGTAKPSAAEQREVRHHLIDLVEPNEAFTVARFVEMADRVICRVRIADQGGSVVRNADPTSAAPLIATGGTPLYYKALFEGLFDGPTANAELRTRLKALPNAELHAKLAEVDPEAAGRIHLNDTKRLVRALEVYELTGKPITSFQTDWAAAQSRHPALWFGLLWDREALNRRINARVKSMISAGWVEETRELLARYGELSPTAAEATGYQEIIQHLHGKMSLEDAIERIKIDTRQLARRQMKWFKRFANVHWFAGETPVSEMCEHVLRTWA
jgi:tRNA dimethylallyltransferase